MYYTIYKITNKVNGKIYIGCHKTKNIDDSYNGSGKLLLRAQKKYGIENFEKEILQVFDNPEDMFKLESELVNEEFVNSERSYNLKKGGEGGWDFNNTTEGIKLREWTWKSGVWFNSGGQAFKERFNNDPEFKKKRLEELSRYAKLGNKVSRERYPEGTFKNRKHTLESKKKMSETKRKRGVGKGELNSQYGTKWIYNIKTLEFKKIKKDQEIPEGWEKGKKPKRFNTKIEGKQILLNEADFNKIKEERKQKKETLILERKENSRILKQIYDNSSSFEEFCGKSGFSKSSRYLRRLFEEIKD